MSMNVARARRLMGEEGVDAIISATLENNLYLGGFWIDAQELFPLDGESYTVAPASAPDSGIVVCGIGSTDQALGGYPSLSGMVTFGTFFRDIDPATPLDPSEQRIKDLTEVHQTGRSAVDALAEAVTRIGAAHGVVAIDERGPDRALIPALSEALPRAKFVSGAALLRRIRAVKTPAEIETLIDAVRITEAGLRAALESFESGITERELQRIFTRTVVDLGAKPGFSLIRFGRGLALGQIPPGDVALEDGDFAFFDVGVNYRGYKSDIGRLVSFGEPQPVIAQLYEATKAGQQAAIDMMRPGVLAKDVFQVAVQTVIDSGIPSYQRQHVGHGIGIEYYDLPVLAPSSDTPLEADMVFEVETPYYRVGVGGSFIEDTILVTDTGTEVVTTLSRDLQILPTR